MLYNITDKPGEVQSTPYFPGKCTPFKTRLVWCIPYQIITGLSKSFQTSPGWCTPIYVRMKHTNKPSMVHMIPAHAQFILECTTAKTQNQADLFQIYPCLPPTVGPAKVVQIP